MIRNKVLKLKKDSTIGKTKLSFKQNQEFEIVMNVVYMGGYPVALNTQSLILNWINSNPSLFTDITKSR